MKTLPLLLAATLLAGCTATGGQDPWAYTKKELYSGGFQLDRVATAGTDGQAFRVTDGSIASIRHLVWINATAGSATVTISDPSGRVVLTTTETAEQLTGLALGEWTVRIDAPPGAQGIVHILVVRG